MRLLFKILKKNISIYYAIVKYGLVLCLQQASRCLFHWKNWLASCMVFWEGAWNPHIYDNLKNDIVLSLYLDIICKGILSIWSKKEPFHIIFLTYIGSKWIAYINSNILSNAVFSHRFMLLLSLEWG